MRIRILPLPAVTVADATHNPFVLVIDQLGHEPSRAEVTHLRMMAESWGARASIVCGGDESIEIDPQLELPQELQQALIDHLDRTVTKENS